jgi:hypothetical protein
LYGELYGRHVISNVRPPRGARSRWAARRAGPWPVHRQGWSVIRHFHSSLQRGPPCKREGERKNGRGPSSKPARVGASSSPASLPRPRASSRSRPSSQAWGPRGLAQNLGHLYASCRGSQSSCWVGLRSLGRPCAFYLGAGRPHARRALEGRAAVQQLEEHLRGEIHRVRSTG